MFDLLTRRRGILRTRGMLIRGLGVLRLGWPGLASSNKKKKKKKSWSSGDAGWSALALVSSPKQLISESFPRDVSPGAPRRVHGAGP